MAAPSGVGTRTRPRRRRGVTTESAAQRREFAVFITEARRSPIYSTGKPIMRLDGEASLALKLDIAPSVVALLHGTVRQDVQETPSGSGSGAVRE